MTQSHAACTCGESLCQLPAHAYLLVSAGLSQPLPLAMALEVEAGVWEVVHCPDLVRMICLVVAQASPVVVLELAFLLT